MANSPIGRGRIVTTRPDGTERTDDLFRVSIKALIYNEAGQILVVKEHGLNWGLPGGGMDFGETFESALTRELEEEAGYTGGFSYEVIDTAHPMYLEGIQAWQVLVVCRVIPEHFDFSVGVDTEAMKFIDPEDLTQYEDSQARFAHHFHMHYQERLNR